MTNIKQFFIIFKNTYECGTIFVSIPSTLLVTRKSAFFARLTILLDHADRELSDQIFIKRDRHSDVNILTRCI